MSRIKKITGIFTFIVILCGISYLSIFTESEVVKQRFSTIELNGNNLLSEADYLSFTRLEDSSEYGNLTLAVVKNRFDKHPYVLKADVAINSKNKAVVNIFEKNIISFLFSDNKQFFVTDKYQLLPLFSNTRFVDYPIISNPLIINEMKPMGRLKEKNIFEAFKIIEAAKNVNIELYRKISEINLRNGGDIIITVSGLNSPVIFGRNEPAKKISYLNSFITEISDKNFLKEQYEYIDLRYDRHIYLGKAETTGI